MRKGRHWRKRHDHPKKTKTYWLVLDGIPIPGRQYVDINQAQNALAKIIADKPAQFTEEQIDRVEVLPIGVFYRPANYNRWGE